jgi:hypothetical protein
MQDRLQVFNREGQLLTYIGTGHGEMPGQFRSLIGVAIDKQNRVFTTEQEPGRLQMFQYVSDADAAAEKTKQEERLQTAAERRQKTAVPAPPDKPAVASPQKAADTPGSIAAPTSGNSAPSKPQN